ncbi:tetratricopeptide repeat protein [bacterium]|nr:tetratricopeptide repeat protein [bacterium]
MKTKFLLLIALLFLCRNVFAADSESIDLFKTFAQSGDLKFREKDYHGALENYKKALQIDDKFPGIHYRLGRVYGFLEPTKNLCDKEYLLALYLYAKSFTNIEQINVETLREFLNIPIDFAEYGNITQYNPVKIIKTDLDKDDKLEILIMMRRGSCSYNLFALEFESFYPQVSHLTTFFEGESGYSDITFKDLIRDDKEEIIVTCEMEDFLNVMIFKRAYAGKYDNILNAAGLFKGNYIFSDIIGDNKFEIEIFEQLLEDTVFSMEKGPYLSKRSIYFWNGTNYELNSSEIVQDYVYSLNVFLRALMVDLNFEEAYKYTEPSKFLNDVGETNCDINKFVELLKTPSYSSLIAGSGADKFVGHIFVEDNIFLDEKQGWDLGRKEVSQVPVITKYVKNLRVYFDSYSFLVTMEYHGGWKVASINREYGFKKKGWAVNENSN